MRFETDSKSSKCLSCFLLLLPLPTSSAAAPKRVATSSFFRWNISLLLVSFGLCTLKRTTGCTEELGLLGMAFNLFRLLILFILERKSREFHFKPGLGTVLGTETHCCVDIKSVWELNFRYQKLRNVQEKKHRKHFIWYSVLMNFIIIYINP